jgi:hypothetical protein
MKSQSLIDRLLNQHLPKRYYGHEARKHAKEMTIDFFKKARQGMALQEEIDMQLILGRELTNEERNSVLTKYGYHPQE